MQRAEPTPISPRVTVSRPFVTWHHGVLIGVALAVAAVSGSAVGAVAPRGPVSAVGALSLMALALVVGVVAGALARSRWIILPALLLHFVGLEVARAGVMSTALEVRLDTVYGIVALIATRGVHLLLFAPALALGVLVGIAGARARGWIPRPAGRRPPLGTALLGALTVGLAVLVAWPASTPPVLGPDGRPVAGSIAELATVRLGGQDHTILVRAANPEKPVLLYLSGGPGQSDLAFSRAFSEPWVNDFVFVDLDQRGNGTSYAAIDPVSSMTIERAVDDVIELTEYLRTRFDEQKIYLMGESWGTILGVLAVQERPDLFHAYVGSGQMANVLETDKRVYADLVAYAEAAGDTALGAKLAEVGEPPYRDFPWANSNLLAWYELIYKPYTPSQAYIDRARAAGFVDPFGITGSEYSFIEKFNVLRGLLDTFALMYPQLYDVDLRESARELEVPVYVLDGASELKGRRDVALEWYALVDAPHKELVTYEGAAHSVAFEQADEVLRLLNEKIVPATYPH